MRCCDEMRWFRFQHLKKASLPTAWPAPSMPRAWCRPIRPEAASSWMPCIIPRSSPMAPDGQLCPPPFPICLHSFVFCVSIMVVLATISESPAASHKPIAQNHGPPFREMPHSVPEGLSHANQLCALLTRAIVYGQTPSSVYSSFGHSLLSCFSVERLAVIPL